MKLSVFDEYRDAILPAAGEHYRAARQGVEPDAALSRVVLPLNLGDLSLRAFQSAEIAQAHLDVAARSAARLAILQDTAVAGGVMGLVAKGEIAMTRIFERQYAEAALQPGGIVDTIRGVEV